MTSEDIEAVFDRIPESADMKCPRRFLSLPKQEHFRLEYKEESDNNHEDATD